jgi:hypothetical protein
VPCLLDTNILLRLVRSADPDYALVRTALQKLRVQGEPRYYLSQNLIEFWNVCKRTVTARGGFGFNLTETNHAAMLLERLFTLLPDTPAWNSADAMRYLRWLTEKSMSS